jgi:hypothetical protein
LLFKFAFLARRPQRPLRYILKINNLDLRIGHIRESGILDKIDHLIQNGINPLPVVSDRTDSQHCSLPQIMVRHLRNGDIEPRPRALQDAAEYLSLPLQGKILMEEKLQVADPDYQFPVPLQL